MNDNKYAIIVLSTKEILSSRLFKNDAIDYLANDGIPDDATLCIECEEGDIVIERTTYKGEKVVNKFKAA